MRPIKPILRGLLVCHRCHCDRCWYWGRVHIARNYWLLERLVLGLERGKPRMFRGKVILPSLLGLALILSLVSSAEARRWRLNFFGLHIYALFSPFRCSRYSSPFRC